MTTRTIPSAITGSDFRNEVKMVPTVEGCRGALSLPVEGTVAPVGGSMRACRRSGRADTRPSEKTKDPTPRSI